jgi:hypothetical protein
MIVAGSRDSAAGTGAAQQKARTTPRLNLRDGA